MTEKQAPCSTKNDDGLMAKLAEIDNLMAQQRHAMIRSIGLLDEIRQEIKLRKAKMCPSCKTGRMALRFDVWTCSDCGYCFGDVDNDG